MGAPRAETGSHCRQRVHFKVVPAGKPGPGTELLLSFHYSHRLFVSFEPASVVS